MKIYQPKRKDDNGKNIKYHLWYADFQDHQDIRRRIPLHSNKATANDWSKFIEQLAIAKSRNMPIGEDVSQWLAVIPQSLKDKLISFELLDSQEVRQGEPLTKHLEEWKAVLIASGTTEQFAVQSYDIVKRHFDSCKFTYISDISASHLLANIADLKRTVKVKDKKTNKLSDKILGKATQTTKNYHLKACNQFCRWMVQDGRTGHNPIESLKKAKSISEKRAALEPEELRVLLNYCIKSGISYGLTGTQRRIVYVIAAQTGYRASEIASLKVSDFDLDGLTVTLSGEHTKNKKDAVIPLRQDTAEELRTYLAFKKPNAKAFKLPYLKNLARMLRKDIETAGIKIEGRGKVDFHGLRHTFGTHLAAAGVHPKTAQTLMRHSNINLTMSRYTHTLRGQESSAINILPDITKAPENQSQVKTGTDDFCVDASVDKDVHIGSNLNIFGGQKTDNAQITKPAFSVEKTGFLGENPNGQYRARTCDPLLVRQVL